MVAKYHLVGRRCIKESQDGNHWQLPQGVFIIKGESKVGANIKCSFLGIRTFCVRIPTGLFQAIHISGDAMVTLHSMGYKNNPDIKRLLKQKNEILAKYEELIKSNPEVFKTKERVKSFEEQYEDFKSEKKKDEAEKPINQIIDLSDYWNKLNKTQRDNVLDQEQKIIENIDVYIKHKLKSINKHTFLDYPYDGSEKRLKKSFMIETHTGRSSSRRYPYRKGLNELHYKVLLRKQKTIEVEKTFTTKTFSVEVGKFWDYFPFSPKQKRDEYEHNQLFDHDSFLKAMESNDAYISNSELLILTDINNKIKEEIENVLVSANEVIKRKEGYLASLDKDGNGIIDVAEGEGDFMRLVKNIQSEISVKDEHMQDFIKVSKFIKQSKKDAQGLFQLIKESQNANEAEEYTGILKNQINTIESIMMHAISMVVSLKEGDKATFYEIHEAFDEMNVFDSKWQRDVSEELNDISKGLSALMYNVDKMNRNITQSLQELTYVTDSNFKSLNSSIISELDSINSSIKFNNLLTAYQTYQSYEINKKLN